MKQRSTIHVTVRTLRAYIALALIINGSIWAPALANPSERISVNFMGAQTTEHIELQAISGNGRYVVFSSADPSIVQNDTNGEADVFVRDLQTQTVVRASVDDHGQQSNGRSSWPVISYDGHIVAFASMATNLAAGAPTPLGGVFVRDMTRGLTYVASASSAGAPAAGGGPTSVSPDGRFVTFRSDATNLVPGDAVTFLRDVFRKDMDQDNDGILSNSGPIEIVNRDSRGVQRAGQHFDSASSELGRYIAFTSDASDLVRGDTNGVEDVFVRDTVNGTTERISIGPNGAQSDAASTGLAISRDGRYVVFSSEATNLLSQPLSTGHRVYRRDRPRAITELVSVDGTQANGILSVAGGINSSGDTVVYESLDEGLVQDDVPGSPVLNVYLRLMSQSSPQPIRRISTYWQPGSTRANDHSAGSYLVNPAWQASFLVSHPVTVSDDATVSFISYATDLTPATDTNGKADLFIQRVPLPNLRARLELSQIGSAVTAAAQVENTSALTSDPVHGHLVIWEAVTASSGLGCVTDPNTSSVVPTDKYVTDIGDVADVSTLPLSNGQIDVGPRIIVGIIRGSPLRYATTGAAIPSLTAPTVAAASVTHSIVAALPAAVVSRFVVDDQRQLVETNESDNTVVKCFTALQDSSVPVFPATDTGAAG